MVGGWMIALMCKNVNKKQAAIKHQRTNQRLLSLEEKM